MSAPYEVRISPPAARALGRLPARLADPVIRFLAEPLASNPYRVTKPLSAEFSGMRTGYVGVAFRVLVEIDDEARVVQVIRIAHRADAHRSL